MFSVLAPIEDQRNTLMNVLELLLEKHKVVINYFYKMGYSIQSTS